MSADRTAASVDLSESQQRVLGIVQSAVEPISTAGVQAAYAETYDRTSGWSRGGFRPTHTLYSLADKGLIWRCDLPGEVWWG
jgi:hypothetical protein